MRFEREDEERLNNIKNKNGLIDYKRINRLIDAINQSRDKNDELVRKHCLVQNLGSLLEKLRMSKNNSERNKIQVGLINSGLRDLKKEIKDMSEEEKEIENPNEIVNLVESILEFNRQQQGKGLKMLKPNQLLSRLPISLAQLKAANNSEKLKNEIRQMLYSLYRSKVLQKMLIKVWLTLFKNGNNLYEHWKK